MSDQPAAPNPRAQISSMSGYVPGSPPACVPGLAPYKLSSNENPNPPLPSVVAEIVGAASTINRYSDMLGTPLAEEIARALTARHPEVAIAVDQVCVGTGSIAVLSYLLNAFGGPDREVVYAWRSFEAYPIAVAVSGSVGVPVPITPTGEHDLAAMLDAVTDQTSMVLLCTPNNPTGTALTHTQVTDFISSVPQHVLVVVDEAYLEYVRMGDAVDGLSLVSKFSNVVVLRTFSKAYGLAGLRVGYCIGHPDIITSVTKTATPFGVSSIGYRAAVASLHAYDELFDRVNATVAERDRIVDAVRELGWSIPETQANFIWLNLREHSARFASDCQKHALAVRPFAEEGVRCSIGEPEGNDRLLQVMAQFNEVPQYPQTT